MVLLPSKLYGYASEVSRGSSFYWRISFLKKKILQKNVAEWQLFYKDVQIAAEYSNSWIPVPLLHSFPPSLWDCPLGPFLLTFAHRSMPFSSLALFICLFLQGCLETHSHLSLKSLGGSQGNSQCFRLQLLQKVPGWKASILPCRLLAKGKQPVSLPTPFLSLNLLALRQNMGLPHLVWGRKDAHAFPLPETDPGRTGTLL